MRSDERSVVAFGGPDAGMPKQMLDGPQIRPMLQQAAGERIPQAMRVQVDAGVNSEAGQGAADVASVGCAGGTARTEHQFPGTGQGVERGYHIARDLRADGHAGFDRHSQRDIPAPEIDLTPAQRGHVAHPQARVEHGQHQGAGADAKRGGAGVVRLAETIHGPQHGIDLPLLKRHGWHGRCQRNPELYCGVRCDVSTVNAEGEEGPQRLQFLPTCRRRQRVRGAARFAARGHALRAEVGNGLNRNASESAVGKVGYQMPQCLAVRADRGRAQAPGGTVLQVRIDGGGQARAAWFRSLWPRLQFSDSRDGAGPVARAERAAVRYALECADCPDGAAALDPCLAVGAVRAGLGVAAVGVQHEDSVSERVKGGKG